MCGHSSLLEQMSTFKVHFTSPLTCQIHGICSPFGYLVLLGGEDIRPLCISLIPTDRLVAFSLLQYPKDDTPTLGAITRKKDYMETRGTRGTPNALAKPSLHCLNILTNNYKNRFKSRQNTYI